MVAFVAPHGASETAPPAQGTRMVVRLVQLPNAELPILEGVPKKVNSVMPVQFWNAPFAMVVIPDGSSVIVIGQFRNALPRMLWSDFGNTARTIFEFQKEFPVISVMLSGSIALVRLVHW